jgi:succinate-semialdehyde dehydrogenase/glutarate-semialdehyde dehydrogenase
MSLISTNPTDEQVLATVPEFSDEQVQTALHKSKNAFESWKKSSFSQRKTLMHKLALILRQERDAFTTLISLEMGMPISQSVGDIEKSAQIAEYYADNAEEFLKNIEVTGDGKSYVSYEPLGVVLHIAPWNYPFYLALRTVIPAVMAGNSVLLKHASNVPQISQTLQALFNQAGFPEGVFTSLMISSGKVEKIIRNPIVSMVTLIGSESAGTKVAKVAGEEVKKTVMELGGNDPFIVLKDADLGEAAKQAALSRLRNQGQSCNAAKRFIVQKEVSEQFTSLVKKIFEEEAVGDPMDTQTTIGPVANAESLKTIQRQVEETLKMGGKVLTGGHLEPSLQSQNYREFRQKHTAGFYYPPTLITDISTDSPLYKEEVFGPVVGIIVVEDAEEAVKVANDSVLGLGASVWTQDLDLAKEIIPQLECGMVCVNSMVRSNIKMPYGGLKRSGYGRELGPDGIKEFVNVKSVVIS